MSAGPVSGDRSPSNILVATHPALQSSGVLLLRLTLGGILVIVGGGKAFGWFGGMGLDAAIQNFVTRAGIPAPLAYLSIFAEVIGGALLVVGFLTRPVALALAINMLVAGIFALPLGFVKTAAYPFSLMVTAIVILLAGPMAYSLDALLQRRRGKP